MPTRHFVPVLTAAIILAGCDASTSEPANSAGGSPGPVPAAALNGQVVKGITRYALISAYMPDGSGGYTLAGTPTLSNADGSFSLPLGSYTGALKITATPSNDPAFPTMMHCDATLGCGDFPSANAADANGNGKIDFGEWGPVAADFELRGVASMVGGGIHFMSLTPLSTLAADWAEQFPDGLNNDSATAANTQVAVAFGFASADELHQPCGDIANDMWRNLASENQLRLPLLIAAFQEAANYLPFNTQEFIDWYADAFVENGGRLVQQASGPEPTVGILLEVQRALVGTLDVPSIDKDLLDDSFEAALQQLESGKLTAVAPVSAERFLDRLGYLGDDLEQVLEITGLDDPEQFVEDQKPNYDWLADDANDGILRVALRTVLYSIVGAWDLSRTPLEGQTEVIYTPAPALIKLDIPGRQLIIQGTHFGQQVDIAVGLTSFRDGVLNRRFVFGIDATLDNAVAHGAVNGTLDFDPGTTDLSALLASLPDTPKTDSGANYGSFSLQLTNLLTSANGSVALEGSASLEKNGEPAKKLGGRVDLTGAFNLGAPPGQQIAALDITDGEINLPDGSHFYKLPSDPVLHVYVGDNASMTIDGGATFLGLPAAIGHAEGTMTHSRELFLHLRDVVIRHMGAFFIQLLAQNASADAIEAFADDLLDFDYGQVVLNGSGRIDIPTLPSASGRGGHQYRGTLTGPMNDATVTIFQPHSNDVALVMNFDPSESRARMTIGGEPWELRAMTTPTPRLIMLGPKGQYSEMSQEDVFNFLEGIPFANVVTHWNPGSD